ncbi:RagB/SusD family nutrient uptake outer membrane protein [Sphingobacterium kitahiroshimense]|uniref:RagB/SusD family nutrient uptake outer membrane protein n=1 Tax=Sphingobacterium kitahiroshimense TaxID=470446 RepID=A0ABV0BVE1_9SPHI
MKYYIGILFMIFFVSCNSFLDVKPDQKMTIPKSLKDCDALLDDYFTMNNNYPVAGEVGSDHYYLSDVNFDAITIDADRQAYLWDSNADIATENWRSSYKKVFNSNQVLEILDKINPETNRIEYNRIKGEALFFRAYAYMQLADIFTLPFDQATSGQQLGLVLRKTAHVDEVSVRATLKDTYDTILKDLSESVTLLPENSNYKTRPTKAAAYAALARVGLVIRDYELVVNAASKCLLLYDKLIDYNSLSQNSNAPFPLFNEETILYATTLTSNCLNPNVAIMDSNLVLSYAQNDLRKQLYFKTSTNGRFLFKGKYDGQINYGSFAGIATDEVYLTLAEAYVHTQQIATGMLTLNKLLKSRFVRNEYVDLKTNDKQTALALIWRERRKSLIMRNVRWMDIKRINVIGDTSITLTRKLKGISYELKPNDNRYAFLIPSLVVGRVDGISQNIR